jgi:Concanavalin A-like lectin/glucanases superfamily
MPRGNGGIIGPVNTSFSGVWSLTEAQLRRSGGTWPNFYAALLSESATGSDVFSGADAADPYFEYTTLLLPGNGTNGAQNNTFLDGSTNNFTITRNGNTTQGTFSPFSQTGWGNYFNGTNAGLSVNVSGISAGTSTFTLEMWIYLLAYPVSDAPIVDTRAANTATTTAFQFGVYSTGAIKFYDGTETNLGGTIPTNQWTHIALVRNASNVVTPYINGTATGTTVSCTRNLTDNYFWIGSVPGPSSPYLNAYLSNLRWVVGTAVYTSNFTPSTTPLTAITNTKLLTCQANRFVDSNTQTTPKTITVNGSPSVQAFSPFNPTASWSAANNGGSGYFDGNGDYLSAASNAAFGVGSGDFTIECWIYLTSNFNSTGRGIITAAYNTNFALIGTNSGAGNKVDFYVANTVMSSGTNYISLNSWTHIACVRSSGTTKIYFNGVEVGSSASLTGTGATAAVYVGTLSHDTTGTMNGYIADARIVKGTAVYTSAFTPPTAPLTAITNTSLLLNFTNAGVVDATSKNDLETVGNAQISTAISAKWGSGCMAFDGTGDYLQSVAKDLFAFGTGDYTVETWVYFTSINSTTLQIIFMSGSTGGNNFYAHVDSNQISVGTTAAFVSNQASSFSTGVWYHIAFCRASGTLRLFKDGVQQGSSVTDSTNWISAGNARCGANEIGTQTLFGYMQDVRITKGYARYTSNFTPPTSAFPTL